jgi:hypothetical protein
MDGEGGKPGSGRTDFGRDWFGFSAALRRENLKRGVFLASTKHRFVSLLFF